MHALETLCMQLSWQTFHNSRLAAGEIQEDIIYGYTPARHKLILAYLLLLHVKMEEEAKAYELWLIEIIQIVIIVKRKFSNPY